MNRTYRTAAGLLLSALVLAGCSSGSTSTTPPRSNAQSSSSVVSTQDLDALPYRTADDVANRLTELGAPCRVSSSSTALSSTGECVLAANGDDTGIKISITVWPTEEKASAGVRAMVDYYNTTGRVTSQRAYLLHSQNWLIDFDNQGVAAGQIEQLMGGTVTTAGR